MADRLRVTRRRHSGVYAQLRQTKTRRPQHTVISQVSVAHRSGLETQPHSDTEKQHESSTCSSLLHINPLREKKSSLQLSSQPAEQANSHPNRRSSSAGMQATHINTGDRSGFNLLQDTSQILKKFKVTCGDESICF